MERLESQRHVKDLENNARSLSPEQIKQKQDNIVFFQVSNKLKLLLFAINNIEYIADESEIENYNFNIIAAYKSTLQQLMECSAFDQEKLHKIVTLFIPLLPWIDEAGVPFPPFFAKMLLDNTIGQLAPHISISPDALMAIKVLSDNNNPLVIQALINIQKQFQKRSHISPPVLNELQARITAVENSAKLLSQKESILIRRLEGKDDVDLDLVEIQAVTDDQYYQFLISNDLSDALGGKNPNPVKLVLIKKRISYLSKAAIALIKSGRYNSAISIISYLFGIKEGAKASGSRFSCMTSIIEEADKHEKLLELFQQQAFLESGYPYFFGEVDTGYYVTSFRNTIPNIFNILESFYSSDTLESDKEFNVIAVLRLDKKFLLHLGPETYNEIMPQLGNDAEKNASSIKNSILVSKNNDKISQILTKGNPAESAGQMVCGFLFFDAEFKRNLLLAMDAHRFCAAIDEEIINAIPAIEEHVGFYLSKRLKERKKANNDIYVDELLTSINSIRKDIDHSKSAKNIIPIADYLFMNIFIADLLSADPIQMPLSSLIGHLHKLTAEALNSGKIEEDALQSVIYLFIIASNSNITASIPNSKFKLDEIANLFLSKNSWTPFSIKGNQQTGLISTFMKMSPKKNIKTFFTIKALGDNSFVIFPDRAPVAALDGAIQFLDSFAVNQKLLVKEFTKNSACLTVDSRDTASQVIKIFNSKILAGLITVLVTEENGKKINKVTISFKENIFGEKQLKDFLELKPQLGKLLCPPTKSAAVPIKISVPEPFQHQSEVREPIKRSPPKTSYHPVSNNNNETKTVEQSGKKKKNKGANKGNNKKANKSKILPATTQAKPDKAHETKIKTTVHFAEEGGRLSGAVPEKMVDVDAPILGGLSRKMSKSESEPRDRGFSLEKLLELLNYANSQMTTILESHQKNEEMFFSLFSPMVIACDVLFSYIDIVLAEKNSSIYTEFSKQELILLKSFRDSLLKDISYYYSNNSISEQLVDKFIALSRKLNSNILITLPVLERRAQDLNSTETFAINWDDIRASSDEIKNIIHNRNLLSETTNFESIKHLIEKFQKLANTDILQAAGLAAMAGMILEPYGVKLNNNSILKEFRDFRNLLAHPDTKLVEFESEILKRLHNIREAKEEVIAEITNLQNKFMQNAL